MVLFRNNLWKIKDYRHIFVGAGPRACPDPDIDWATTEGCPYGDLYER